MNHVIRTLRILAFLVISTATIALSQGVTVTLLHINDTHSHLDGFGPKDAELNDQLGGIARAATAIGTIRATEPNVLLLHAGDSFQGDPIFNTYFSVPELQLLNQLGVDAMAVGNHEFGYGPDALAYVLSTAFPSGGFPLLSANLDLSGYPTLANWIEPSMIKTIGGVKIGIFGLLIPGEPSENAAPVIIEDTIFNVAATMVQQLRGEGAQAVICLSHLGIYLDRILAENVPGIDFIVGGHDHFVFDQPVAVQNPLGATTYIFQAGSFYEYLGDLKFTIDNGAVTIDSYHMITLDGSVTPDPTVQAAVNEIKLGVVAKFGDLYHEVVATTPNDISKFLDVKTPLRDTPLGNLVTDAYREFTGTDIAIDALGLISEKLYKGKIVGADIFRTLSYGYDPATGYGLTLATLDIKGSELVKGMEFGLSQLGITDDFFLQYSGMRFRYDPQMPVGQRVILSSIDIHGQGFNPEATYSATVNSGAVMLLGLIGINVENVVMLPDYEFNVVKNFIAEKHEISYQSQGRILEMPRNIPLAAQGKKPAKGITVGNSPNPFNPSTIIHYELPDVGQVRVAIFNTIGQQVALLVDGEGTAGAHDVTWNAAGEASGVYFYALRFTPSQKDAPPLVKFGKMVLAK